MIGHSYNCAFADLSYKYKIFFKHGYGKHSNFEMVPASPIITGITFFFIPHALYFCCKVFIF